MMRSHTDEIAVVDRRPGATLRQLRGRRPRQLRGEARRDLRLPRPQRRRQVDHDPHAHAACSRPLRRRGTVAGFDFVTEAERIKAHIGYMSQKFSLYDDLTVEENIDFYSGIYRLAAAKKRERKEWVLEMAGLRAAPRHAHGVPLRRLEAAAGARLRDPPRARHRLPRRADLGRRSAEPPRVLGPDLLAVRTRA